VPCGQLEVALGYAKVDLWKAPARGRGMDGVTVRLEPKEEVLPSQRRRSEHDGLHAVVKPCWHIEHPRLDVLAIRMAPVRAALVLAVA